MTRQYFGTDGVRGKVGEFPITTDFATKLGYAAGKVFRAHWTKTQRPFVLIGKDTRISGYLLESALKTGFMAAGVDVKLLGVSPTPAVAYLTRTFHAAAGVVVSASHNPFYDNGIKFFSSQGRKLSDAIEAEIEAAIDAPQPIVESEHLGKLQLIKDGIGRYIEFCKSTVPNALDLNGLTIVVDCANGATYHIAANVFTELGATVIPIHNEPNGTNINDSCGATDLKSLSQKVREIGADLGIAFDGDGDRVMLVNQRGETLDGDAILYLIAKGECDNGQRLDGVVGTKMSNKGLETAIKQLGLTFERTDVGDRYVMERLVAKGLTLGGESSGHIICLDKVTTGDGIVAALQVLNILVRAQTSLDALLQDYQVFPQTLENIVVKDKKAIMQHPDLLAAINAENTALGDSGRLLIRASGTEPKVRVMVEALDAGLVADTVARMVALVKTLDN